MKISEPILFDTNVLVYNQDRDSRLYLKAAKFHQQAISGEIKAVISSQNLLEFTAVMVNPKKIVRPLSQIQVAGEIEKYLKIGYFRVIYPNIDTITSFSFLLKKYQTKNPRKIFDIFLVATMLSNKIKYILTANAKDFRFKEVKIVGLT